MIIDSIRGAPDWQDGNYQTQPHGLRVAVETLYFMGSNPVQRLKEAPTLAQADKALDSYVATLMKQSDANDVLYALEASRDYDPGPGLERIKAPLLAINFDDDLINPAEIDVLKREIKRVKSGKAIFIPMSNDTRGHGTHTLAGIWKRHLATFLKRTEPRESQRQK